MVIKTLYFLQFKNILNIIKPLELGCLQLCTHMILYWVSFQLILLVSVGNFVFYNKNDKGAEVK